MLNTKDIINNPLSIQKAVLDEYHNNLDGEAVVVDANNSFMFLLESFSRITADATEAMDTKLSGLYPRRANTTKELFNHLSDFDYVGFFSYPASLKLSIMLHRDYLVKHAIQVPDTNYKLVIIPADTIFTIGRFRLGLYYPIHIKINTVIDTISASYDTTEENPLRSLATNTLEVRANTFEGIDLIHIEFDTFQFDKKVITESINPEIGFIKTYQFDNKFYAIRVFDISSSTRKELSYTMSDSVYDIGKPTVNLKVYPETNEITLAIPQIYFTSNLIGNKIQVELYSTVGEIDASLNNLQLTDISANFAMDSPNTDLTYTNILKNIPTAIISPVDTRITGGSNSYTFNQMKDFTIYHNNATSVPITRMDLDRFFSRNGFKYLPKIDNLTDRRYYAYKKLYIDDQELGVTSGGLTVQYKEGETNSNVLYQNNDTIVLLPTVLYKFVPAIRKFEILSDTERNLIVNGSGIALANKLNDGNYFSNPHHIVITTLDRYPACDTYDLLTTEATNVTFIEENAYLSAQLSLITVMIRHLGDGSRGYVIRIGVQKSEDLKDVPIDDLNCFLTVMTKEGYRIGTRGAYIGTYNGLEVFDFTVSTNYKIKGTRIAVTNMNMTDSTPSEYEIELNGTMHIATFIKKSYFPTAAQNETILNRFTQDDNTWLGISLQSFEYSLGNKLSDIIDANILTNWTDLQYKLHETDIPMLYEHDVYETNIDGTLKYSIEHDEVITTKLHSIGDPILDTEGNPIMKYVVGDVVRDAGGNPIQIQSRIKDFTIDLNGYDYSHQVVTTDFLISLSKELSSYYETIRTMNNDVLENTDIYFRPIVTTSDGQYKINNSTIINSSLELEFEFNCYVAQAVLDDTIMIEALSDKIITIIKTHLNDTILSLTEVAYAIRTELGTYVNSIDVVSLNGDTHIQTLMNVDIDKAPKLGMKLSVGRDNRFTYVPKVTVNFKALDT